MFSTRIGRVCLLALLCTQLGCQSPGDAAPPARAEAPATAAPPSAATDPAALPQATTVAAAGTPNTPISAPVPQAAAAADSSTTCSRLCAHSDALHCSGAAGCQAACMQMFVEPLCPAAFDAFMACALREPTAHFECGEEGVAALADGYCAAEQRAFAHCVQAEALGAP